MTREEMRLALIVYAGQLMSNEPMETITQVGRDYLAGCNRYKQTLTEEQVNKVMTALLPLIEDKR